MERKVQIAFINCIFLSGVGAVALVEISVFEAVSRKSRESDGGGSRVLGTGRRHRSPVADAVWAGCCRNAGRSHLSPRQEVVSMRAGCWGQGGHQAQGEPQ